jgi:hypothetical protein
MFGSSQALRGGQSETCVGHGSSHATTKSWIKALVSNTIELIATLMNDGGAGGDESEHP